MRCGRNRGLGYVAFGRQDAGTTGHALIVDRAFKLLVHCLDHACTSRRTSTSTSISSLPFISVTQTSIWFGAIRVVEAQVVAADDAAQQQSIIDLLDGDGAGDDEFVEERLTPVNRVAVELVDLVGGVMRLVPAEFRHLTQPILAEQFHVDRRRQRHQALIGADVAGRLLAADVLLARAERHHVSLVAVGVERLADNAPGDAADLRHFGGEEADVRSAVAERDAERLPLTDDDVRAEFAGAFEQRQRQRISDEDQQRARFVDFVGESGEVLDLTEEVGVSDRQHCRVVVEQVDQIADFRCLSSPTICTSLP